MMNFIMETGIDDPASSAESTNSEDSQRKFSKYCLPGLNLPLDWNPQLPYGEYDSRADKVPSALTFRMGEGRHLFKNALENDPTLDLTTLREFTMLQIMDSLTDKEGWEEKIHDETITNKWKSEILATPGRDVSQPMVEWIIKELQYKAGIFKDTGAVSVYTGDVVKSDTAVSPSLKNSLKEAVRPLEDVPEKQKDYHPGSDGKVIDLVHPSLFPLIYGRSRISHDHTIGLDECVNWCGKGDTIPNPSSADEPRTGAPYSHNFQWLPCDVDISAKNSSKITTYINNLRPDKNAELYHLIEQVIDSSIPLWNTTLTGLKSSGVWNYFRIKYDSVEYDPDPDPDPYNEEDEDFPGRPQRRDNEDEDDFCDRFEEWLRDVRKVVQPEPGEFQPPHPCKDHFIEEYVDAETGTLKSEKKVDLHRDYGHRGLQIIVKLANIVLTPEKPEYDGGTWHVEGQLNEHICATALYYYHSENITESRLEFRQQSDADTMEIDYAQNEHYWLQDVFGCENEGPALQEIGSVACTEGRLLTFPNILQHRVRPFRLADPTKKGERKILALFLVDPNIRVISTANVPPQQKEWWREEVLRGGTLDKLSTELQEQVFDRVDEFPISMHEAKVLRDALMDERRRFTGYTNTAFEHQQIFSLCEH